MAASTRAVVFAYHNVGARCLRVLLAHGVDVPLVVTHEVDPLETVWFTAVSEVAKERSIPWMTPDDPNAPQVVSTVAALKPDFLFSFYYRKLLGPQLLALPPRGALNLHGSLLPRYRGRSPVNWAVLHGERETGASLHYMTAKPDAGDLVAQQSVPILPDDTAREVLDKVTFAAELALDRVLPALLAGNAPRVPQNLAIGSYFGGRRPADGEIDWTRNAQQVHNLVRAVAPPYPGATTRLGGRPARLLRTLLLDASGPRQAAVVHFRDNALVAFAGGGGSLRLLELEVEGVVTEAEALRQRFGDGPIALSA